MKESYICCEHVNLFMFDAVDSAFIIQFDDPKL